MPEAAENLPVEASAVGNPQLQLTNDEAIDRELPGPERAAVLLLALGENHGRAIWEQLDELEIREVSLAMARLGPITGGMLERLLADFITKVSINGELMGNFDSTERLLSAFLPGDRVDMIMEEIRGPAGRNLWEKLSNVQENVLANYLKNEYPQTVAVVLSKIRSEHAARVLSIFPEEFAMEVISRMLSMDAVQKDVLEKVEQTLRIEFMSNLSQTTRRDAHEQMADIFNNFDRQTESRFLSTLEDTNRESAEKIKNLMFTFDDLTGLDSNSVQTLLRQVDNQQLAIALKGAGESVRDFFFQNMSGRAAKLLAEDMETMGAIRLREVDEAQGSLVNMAKDMAAKGEIIIAKNSDDELIF